MSDSCYHGYLSPVCVTEWQWDFLHQGVKPAASIPLTKPQSPAFALKNRLRSFQKQAEAKVTKKCTGVVFQSVGLDSFYVSALYQAIKTSAFSPDMYLLSNIFNFSTVQGEAIATNTPAFHPSPRHTLPAQVRPSHHGTWTILVWKTRQDHAEAEGSQDPASVWGREEGSLILLKITGDYISNPLSYCWLFRIHQIGFIRDESFNLSLRLYWN